MTLDHSLLARIACQLPTLQDGYIDLIDVTIDGENQQSTNDHIQAIRNEDENEDFLMEIVASRCHNQRQQVASPRPVDGDQVMQKN